MAESSTVAMVTVEVGGHKVTMTAPDASQLAYKIQRQAIEAAEKNGLGEQEEEPSFGDFYIESPEITLRVEQADRGQSIALIARGKERPHVWLWFGESDAVRLAALILDIRTKSAKRGGKTLSVKLRPERQG